MTILYRKSRFEINSIQQLLDYINDQSRISLKWIGVKPDKETILDQWVKSPIEIRHKQLYKEFRNLIGAKSNRVIQLEYYLERGYSYQFAKEQVHQQQSKRGKRGWNDGKFENRITSTNLEWWIQKCNGDVEKAKKLYKERQATFTLEKCIEKYGKRKGTQIWKDRQKQWQSNLDHSTFDTAVTFKNYLNKFKDFNLAFREWLLLADSKRIKDFQPSIIFKEMSKLKFNSKDDVLDYLLNRNTLHDVKDSILSVLNITQNQFKSRWLKHNNINNIGKLPDSVCIYGNKYYIGDHYFESNLELELGLLLIEHDIDFICHKQYPSSKRKYDFYIRSIDTYVEVTGMPDDNYQNKMEELKHIPNIIWSNQPKEIFNMIKRNC